MTDEQKLRAEFEVVLCDGLGCPSGFDPSINTLINEAMFATWKAAHAKYAPRWLPIDDAAKAYRFVMLIHDVDNIAIGYWHHKAGAYYSIDAFKIMPTHYMPIPDAPEVE